MGAIAGNKIIALPKISKFSIPKVMLEVQHLVHCKPYVHVGIKWRIESAGALDALRLSLNPTIPGS